MRLFLLIAVTIALTVLQLRAEPTEMAVEMVKAHEGYHSKMYKDTDGYSIGYGTNLNYVNKDMAEFLLYYTLNRNDTNLGLMYDWYNELPYIPRSIVQDMAYNMGLPRFSKFKKMHYQLSKGNWVKAALEMKNSIWYKQVGTRSVYLFDLMRNYKENK